MPGEAHPLVHRIVVLEKITDYLLSRKTEKSSSRCRFFLSYGFAPDDPQRLLEAIRQHPETGIVTPLPPDAYGQRWNVVGPIATPDRRNPVIRTGGIKTDAGPPRFVTAIPKAR